MGVAEATGCHGGSMTRLGARNAATPSALLHDFKAALRAVKMAARADPPDQDPSAWLDIALPLGSFLPHRPEWERPRLGALPRFGVELASSGFLSPRWLSSDAPTLFGAGILRTLPSNAVVVDFSQMLTRVPAVATSIAAATVWLRAVRAMRMGLPASSVTSRVLYAFDPAYGGHVDTLEETDGAARPSHGFRWTMYASKKSVERRLAATTLYGFPVAAATLICFYPAWPWAAPLLGLATAQEDVSFATWLAEEALYADSFPGQPEALPTAELRARGEEARLQALWGWMRRSGSSGAP